MTTVVKCPTCGKDVRWTPESRFRPFCSERCKQMDLGAWAAEKYVVCDPIFDEDEIPEADRRALRQGARKPDETIH